MRITLTGRRLALAATLVVGGVAAAPLAYATITAPASKESKVAPTTFGRLATTTFGKVTPSAAASPLSSRASTAVADNPYQQIIIQTIASGLCGFMPAPASTNWVLDAVSFVAYSGGAGTVWVSPVIKNGPSTSLLKQPGFRITLDPDGNGERRFSLLVKNNTEAGAAIGDVYALNVCVIPSTPSVTFALTVTGQKVSGPTPVSVSDFTARSRARGALLHWKTASETQILGFNVWRYRGAKGVKVNRALIRAKRSGEPAGASYRYIDPVRGVKRGLTYRLQLVDLKGKRTWYAAFAIASK